MGKAGYTFKAVSEAKLSPSKQLLLLRVIWTFISLGSACLILAFTLGSAAWNGVNFIVALYLIGSGVGVVGIPFGFWASFSGRRFPAMITIVGATCIAVLSVVYSGGFIFERAPGVLLSSSIGIGKIHLPLPAFYGIAFCCCPAEILLFASRMMGADPT